MGFSIHQTDDNRIPGFEYIPCTATNVKVGSAVTLTSGTAVLATGTNKPMYIAVSEPKDGNIQAVRVLPDIIFETTCSASVASTALGTKLTLHTDGEKVTATATNGVAELVYKESGGAAGSVVRVRFS